jgi:hypothetical protein
VVLLGWKTLTLLYSPYDDEEDRNSNDKTITFYTSPVGTVLNQVYPPSVFTALTPQDQN